MEFIIRRMNASDVTPVASIERASFSMPWSERAFRYELYNPASLCYVAVSDSAIAGYIIARQILDEGHILNLAVRPDMRRQGIAEALAKKIISEMKAEDCRIIYLEVRASNTAARNLYEKLGFRIEGIRRAYYDNPKEDAVLMVLKLPG